MVAHNRTITHTRLLFAAAEHYVDRRTYTFSRGADMVVVLTNGNYSDATPRPAAYNLSGLANFAGRTLCDALRSGVRLHDGRAAPAVQTNTAALFLSKVLC